jgi:hypothetical protein
LHINGYTQKEIAKLYGLCRQKVNDICTDAGTMAIIQDKVKKNAEEEIERINKVKEEIHIKRYDFLKERLEGAICWHETIDKHGNIVKLEKRLPPSEFLLGKYFETNGTFRNPKEEINEDKLIVILDKENDAGEDNSINENANENLS